MSSSLLHAAKTGHLFIIARTNDGRTVLSSITNFLPIYPMHNWGIDVGNLLQGGEAYVKFFAENTHFQGRSDCAPEYQSNTP